MKVAILCYGFKENNIRLQPWRYIYEIAKGLIIRNVDVTIITDGSPGENIVNGIPVTQIGALRKLPFQRNGHLISCIVSKVPDVLLLSVSPIDYLYMNVYKQISVPIIGIFTGPIYKSLDIIRIGIREIISDFSFFLPLIIYSLSPSFFLRNLVNSPHIKKFFVMSLRNKEIIIEIDGQQNKIVHIPVGVDGHDRIRPNDPYLVEDRYNLDQRAFNILYFGSPLSMRGIDLLINSVSRIKDDHPDVKLLVLSRRRNGELREEEELIHNLTRDLDIEKNVKIISGFFDKEDVKRFICFSDVVALPFKLVMSDVPTSILESMAMGKIVISTDVDGIPELLEDGRGLLVKPAAQDDLTQKITYCIENFEIAKQMGVAAELFIREYPCWDDVSEMVYEVIAEIGNGRSVSGKAK